MDATAWFSSSVTEIPAKTGLPKRKSYDPLLEDDEEDDVNLNAQMIPIEDDFVAETGIDCTLTQEAEEAGNVYAPHFPIDATDDIHVLLTTPHGVRKTILAIETSDDVSRDIEVKFKFWGPEKKGTYEYQVFVKSSSYVGCDIEKYFKFKVLGADQIPKVEAHPLDESLKHMPTWQEQMRNPDADFSRPPSDSDDSDEDEDAGSGKANKLRQRWKERKERKRKEAEIKRRKAEQKLSGESSSYSDEEET